MGKRGAPKGNQNAVKHGFYCKVLADTEKREIKRSGKIEGLDNELALLRVKLRRLLAADPDRFDLQIRAIGMIARMSRTRNVLAPKDRKALKEAIARVLKEVAR